MKNPFNNNPEPVPAASQLAVMPFLAAVEGFLNISRAVPGLRITIHRTVNREGQIYLQVNPMLNLRNFPHEPGIFGAGKPTVYASVQESLTEIQPPRFKSVVSFNYEAAAA